MKKLILILFFLSLMNIYSQSSDRTGETPNKDTVFVFQSPRELLTYNAELGDIRNAIAGEFFISESGFGGGFFYGYYINPNTTIFTNIYIGGAREGDEFNQWVSTPDGPEWRVPNKINRLFSIPFMFGLQKFLFSDDLEDSFKPYLIGGVGPTLIIAAPYTENREVDGRLTNWFTAFGEADYYLKPGGYLGVGAYFGKILGSLLGAKISYYYIPFGDEGLESQEGRPVENFGGVFISLSVGVMN